ncbi:ABC-2 family transporter protein [Patescibacteria group bacterium]|nr:ABC-2 family transporter protein [Patescibacteria group bacterium]
MKDIKVWWRLTLNSFQQVLSNRPLVLIFMTGKILRVVIFLAFLGFLFQGTKSLAGYNREQIIFFYLAFNLIDTLGQLFFREVYRFRPLVVSGELDYILVKPLNTLTRVLAGGADVMDLFMLVLLTIITFTFAFQNFVITPVDILLFIVLAANGLLISAAFYIFVLGIGIMTTSVDHMVMIYRDLGSMLRIPVDLYIEPIRFLLTFALPLGIMITFPAKAMLGILPMQLVLVSFIFGITSLSLSLKFWKYALKKYSSASS